MNTVLGLLAIFFFAYSIVMTMLWIRAKQDAEYFHRLWLEELIYRFNKPEDKS